MTQDDTAVVALVHEVVCPGCGVGPGRPHRHSCRVERCSVCGSQRLACVGRETTPDPPGLCDGHDPESVVWTGEWPGVAECRSRGWWCVRNPNGSGYVQCRPETPGAHPDLNRLFLTGWTFKARTEDFVR